MITIEKRKYKSGSFDKRCTCCGKVYDEHGWGLLYWVGNMAGSDEGIRYTADLEMRNCGCGSTLAVKLESLTDQPISKMRLDRY